MERQMYSDRVKLDESNWNAAEGSYEATAKFKDGEEVKFSYAPGEYITYNGDSAVGKLFIPGKEYPVAVKEREGKTGKYLSGCLNFDEKRFCNLKRQTSQSDIEIYTISFSKLETKSKEVDPDAPFN